MRRLLLLIAAFLLALLAGSLALGAESSTATHVHLRDGMVIALLTTALAAWASVGYPRAWHKTTWSTVARALIGSGIVTALIAIALRFAPIAGLPNLSEIVWAVGMLAALAGIALPPVIVRFAPPAFTWTKGGDGKPTRKSTTPNGDPINTLSTGRGWWIALLLVVGLGIAARVWSVTNLPPVCRSGVYDECSALLAFAPDAQSAAFTSVLVVPLARVLMGMGEWLGATLSEPLWALRWASALIAMLTLPALALALRPLTGWAGVLLGVALYAVHPLFVTLAADPVSESLLYLLLAVAGGASALRSENPRGWALTGITLGLLTLTQPSWLLAWLLWLGIATTLMLRRPLSGIIAPIATLIGAALAGAALATVYWSDVPALWALNPGAAGISALAERVNSALANAPSGTMWVLALMVVGIGGAFRLRRVGIYLLGVGATLTLVAALIVLTRSAAADETRLLLVFVILLAAIAIDQIVRAAQRTWTPLIRSSAWLALGLVILVGISGWNLYQQSEEQASMTLPVDDQAALATIDFIQAARRDSSLSNTTWLLAPPLFNHGGVRSATNLERTEGRLLPFAAVADLPFASEAAGGLVYILPASDSLTMETLQAVYPEGRTLPLASGDGAAAIRIWRVDAATLFDSTGLAQFVYAGSDFGSADEAALSLGVGPLDFGWETSPPRELPFSVEWSGSLLVRTPGAYTFAVTAPPGATFSMTLDDRLLLDTSLGLLERSETLPEGPQRIEMRYRSGDAAGDLAILWQPPGEDLAPIPRTALYNPAIPAMGLIGVYSSGSAWDGAVFAQRKDLQVIPDATLELPWGVVWQGYLAAPRAGEYLIGAVTNGALLMDVDGKRLLTQMPSVLGAVSPPSEATIYLPQGWTPITIRFAPDAGNAHLAPEMRLYWQPPGGEAGPLRATFLSPAISVPDGGEITRPLPALPSVNTRLGNEDFALSADNTLWMPQERIPPGNLPLLPFENEARWASCGVDEGQLAAPRGLAWDAQNGIIYIADAGAARVVALALDSGVMTTLPIVDLEEPVDVALTPTGELLVLDTVSPKLIVYDPATQSAETILLTEGFYRPRALAVDGGGIIYVADTGGARIAALMPDGDLLTAFGGPDTNLGKGQPAAVGVTSRSLWAVAAEQGRLWHLNTLGSLTALQRTDTINGPHIAALPPQAAGAPGSAGATAVAATFPSPLAETIFVSDPARRQILWFAGTGQPLGALADEAAFEQPTGVAVILEGDDLLLAVADATRCDVSLWRATVENLDALLPQ